MYVKAAYVKQDYFHILTRVRILKYGNMGGKMQNLKNQFVLDF